MKTKTIVIVLAILLGLVAVAYAAMGGPQGTSTPRPPEQAAACPCMQGAMMGGMMGGMMGNMGNMPLKQGMMGKMQQGSGMMGMQPGMMSFCPMMIPGAKVEVKSLDHGASITITSGDAKTARRIQLMSEMMRVMQELRSEQ